MNKNLKYCLLIALLTLFTGPCLAQADNKENDSQQHTASEPQQSTQDQAERTAQSQAERESEKPADQESFQPSEEISEDLSVSFPVDI